MSFFIVFDKFGLSLYSIGISPTYLASLIRSLPAARSFSRTVCSDFCFMRSDFQKVFLGLYPSNDINLFLKDISTYENERNTKERKSDLYKSENTLPGKQRKTDSEADIFRKDKTGNNIIGKNSNATGNFSGKKNHLSNKIRDSGPNSLSVDSLLTQHSLATKISRLFSKSQPKESVISVFASKLHSSNVSPVVADIILSEVLASCPAICSPAQCANILRLAVSSVVRFVDLESLVSTARSQDKPFVLAFVGTNGCGKSTSLAKVAAWFSDRKFSVLMAACDVFRPGAVEQLRAHGESLRKGFPKMYQNSNSTTFLAKNSNSKLHDHTSDPNIRTDVFVDNKKHSKDNTENQKYINVEVESKMFADSDKTLKDDSNDPHYTKKKTENILNKKSKKKSKNKKSDEIHHPLYDNELDLGDYSNTNLDLGDYSMPQKTLDGSCNLNYFNSLSIEDLQNRVDVFDRGYAKCETGVLKAAYSHAVAEKFDVLLVDTAGRTPLSRPLMDALSKLLRAAPIDHVCYVAEALTGSDSSDYAKAFGDAAEKATGKPLDSIFVTKTDAAGSLGQVLSLAHAANAPIIFLGTGQTHTSLRQVDPETVAADLIEI